MEVVRTLDLFTVKEHINTVAVFDSSSVWVVLHNLGRVRRPNTLIFNVPCGVCTQ
jgi:hypothetical protein